MSVITYCRPSINWIDGGRKRLAMICRWQHEIMFLTTIITSRAIVVECAFTNEFIHSFSLRRFSGCINTNLCGSTNPNDNNNNNNSQNIPPSEIDNSNPMTIMTKIKKRQKKNKYEQFSKIDPTKRDPFDTLIEESIRMNQEIQESQQQQKQKNIDINSLLQHKNNNKNHEFTDEMTKTMPNKVFPDVKDIDVRFSEFQCFHFSS
jgi:hypothetical protein